MSVDGFEVLGLDVTASPSDVRSAADRLVRHVRSFERRRDLPSVSVLERVVVDARDAVLTGRPFHPPPPARVLGVSAPVGGDVDAVRAAWRRLAAVSHPDAGGTAGLFRVVSEAHDELTDPLGTLRRRARQDRRAGWGFIPDPPSKPPPPGPFAAPAPADRVVPRRGDAVLDLVSTLPLAAGWITAASIPIVWQGRTMLPSSLLIAAVTGLFLRVRADRVVWAVSRLRMHSRLAARAKPDATPSSSPPPEDPAAFLAERGLDAPVARVAHRDVWHEYVRWCSLRNARPLPEWTFVEELRSYGLLFVGGPDRLRARWVGLRLRA